MYLIFATRPSPLARRQTQSVIHALQKYFPGLVVEEKVITTRGDQILDKPLPEIGGKGLFTQELEKELLNGDVHCAVHSLKDLPIEDTPGLTVGCIPLRADAHDVLISAQGYRLATLPTGASLGTSSLRRAAQILATRPDLELQPLRGNIETRLRKALERQYEAILLAEAGLMRLELDQNISEQLDFEVMLPAPGQGALAVQCRLDDTTTLELLSALEHAPTRLAVTAERQFLLGLGGGCSAPVAAYATVTGEPTAKIHLRGRVISIDGQKVVNVSGRGADPIQLGNELAEQARQLGAQEILSLLEARTAL